MEDHRNYPRFQLKNMSVDVSDGRGFYSGFIGDISKFGLCLKQIPSDLSDEYNRLTVVVAKDDANFRLIVRPRWENLDGFTKDIGVRIVESSPEWKQYVEALA